MSLPLSLCVYSGACPPPSYLCLFSCRVRNVGASSTLPRQELEFAATQGRDSVNQGDAGEWTPRRPPAVSRRTLTPPSTTTSASHLAPLSITITRT